MLAAKKGDAAKVEKLLNEGTDVKGINGSRALVLAVQANHLEIAQKLLEHGADPNVSVRITYFSNTEGKPNTQGRVDGILLLRQAIRDNKVRTVNLLLNAGANPNLQDSNTDSMLQEALLNNTYISFLNAYNETVQPIKFPIIGQERVEIVLAMITKGVNVEQRDRSGRTVLMLAAGQGQTEIVRQLLNKGAKVNAVTIYGDTPLMYAAARGSLATVKVLIEKGANINAAMMTFKRLPGATYKTVKVPKTALVYAQESRSQEVVKYLLQSGAKTLPS